MRKKAKIAGKPVAKVAALASKRGSLYSAPALEKGLAILEVMTKSNRALLTEEIAQAVGRSRNEIYRMLQVLDRHGYIAKDTSGERYIATQKLFSLGMHSAPVKDLTTAAIPEMETLTRAVGHSVHLVVPSEDQIVFISRVESPATFGFSVSLGYRRPVIDSTSGCVLFAFQRPDRQAQWLKQLRETAPVNADIDTFQADARRARADGWLIRPSLTVQGVIDIAAPIWSSESDGCIANLLVPMMDIVGQKLTKVDTARACRAAADRISQHLRPHISFGS